MMGVWQKTSKYGIVIHHELLRVPQVLMFIIIFCVLGVFYLFVGLLCLMFALQLS
jgi:hypothetical protein